MAKMADSIRAYGREKYVQPARERHQGRFPIRTGDVVRNMKLNGRTPAVCSALKSREFLQENGLRLVDESGPPSGQSTTVIYTYEFVDLTGNSSRPSQDAWTKLRGALKEVFAELGGGEAYLRRERENFYGDSKDKS